MYCPNCGKTNSNEQKFCRACGLNLEQTGLSLAQQLPAAELENKLHRRERQVERWLIIAGVSAISILVLGVLWGVIYKIIIIKGDVVEGLGFLAFILGVVLFAILALYRDSLRKASKRQLPEATTKPAANTAELLNESHFEPISSVTERTTELLATKKKF